MNELIRKLTILSYPNEALDEEVSQYLGLDDIQPFTSNTDRVISAIGSYAWGLEVAPWLEFDTDTRVYQGMVAGHIGNSPIPSVALLIAYLNELETEGLHRAARSLTDSET